MCAQHFQNSGNTFEANFSVCFTETQLSFQPDKIYMLHSATEKKFHG
jgi:hypothetical protein